MSKMERKIHRTGTEKLITPEVMDGFSTYPPIESEFTRAGYREVGMMFNVGRIEGAPARGFDGITSDDQRRYFVEGSSEASEEKIRQALGEHAVLTCLEREGDLSVYEVPLGTKLLRKILSTAPFRHEYMAKLQSEGEDILARLSRLDSASFGIDINSIAVAHNGDEEDDVYLTVVPPLKPPEA